MAQKWGCSGGREGRAALATNPTEQAESAACDVRPYRGEGSGSGVGSFGGGAPVPEAGVAAGGPVAGAAPGASIASPAVALASPVAALPLRGPSATGFYVALLVAGLLMTVGTRLLAALGVRLGRRGVAVAAGATGAADPPSVLRLPQR